MDKLSYRRIVVIGLLAIVLISTDAWGTGAFSGSIIERESVRARYNTVEYTPEGLMALAAADDSGLRQGTTEAPVQRKYRSPGKAFFLSLAVPGLGQYYYGSKVKPFVFFGVEAASWILYLKWHSDGNNLTDEYEAFNRTHWSRTSYEDYLYTVYGYGDDDSISATEVSHHLPDEETQQYFEMTGKYDQFAWGWDDALLEGQTLEELGSAVPAIVSEATTPNSANRMTYEQMRDDANNAYDRATRMVFVSISNHVISAFEALFTAKSLNKKVHMNGDEFSRLKIRTKLKSCYTRWDTPYLTVAYKF